MIRRAAVGVGAVVLAATTLSACASTAAPATPIPVDSAWRPGLLVDGYGPQGLGPSASGDPSANASASGTASAAAGDQVQRTLATVGLLAGDVGAPLRTSVPTDGTALSQPSLTYCSGSYPSESTRAARRRVEVVDSAGGSTGIASETVLYRTVSDARAALAQLRGVVAACPTPRTVTSGSVSLTITAVPSSDVDTSGLVPATDRVMVSSTIVDGSSDPYRLTRIWQVRGKVLVGVFYSAQTATFSPQDLSNVHLLASRVAERLDALDASFVGTS